MHTHNFLAGGGGGGGVEVTSMLKPEILLGFVTKNVLKMYQSP